MENVHTFPVKRQGFQVRDKRLQPETWNLSGSQENVVASARSTLESSRIPYRRLHPFATPSATGEVPEHVCTLAPVAREEERIGSTIPMPTVASRPSTMSSFMLVEVPQSSVVGKQRQQISEVQSCSGFPSEAMS